MRNIWEVLLQTLTASAIGIYILLFKTIFHDKLPPRWHFSVWGILLFGLILPAKSTGIFSLITETLKTLTSGEFSISRPLCFFPLITNFTEINIFSILFLIYISGVVISAAKYLFSFIRLKSVIRKCPAATEENRMLIEETAKEYSLPVCKTVTLKGASSPFVCGIIKPVMVLPEHTVDKKIILHELLHLKYKDIIFGAVICVFRCIHWFNPLLQFLFNKINNDMEQLCDSRVIERLEGEAIRDYGNILLSMANKKYASFPGTSSASNGGKNIQARIKTLVHYKNYPKNSSFISICITIVLAAFLLLPDSNISFPVFVKAQNASDTVLIMSAVRSYSCSTPAGALDAYGKAVIDSNALCRALSAPLDEHDELYTSIKNSLQKSQKAYWDAGLDSSPEEGSNFQIYNFIKNDDGSYNALLVVKMPYYNCDNKNEERYATQELHIYEENGRWVVSPVSDFSYTVTYGMLGRWGCDDLPGIIYTAKTDDFIIECCYQLSFLYNDSNTATNTTAPLISAEFSEAYINTFSSVTYIGSEENKEKITTVGLATQNHSRSDKFPEFKKSISGTFSSSSSSGTFISSIESTLFRENKEFLSGGGTSADPKTIQSAIPECIAAGLYINGELVNTLILERVN